MPAHRLTVAHGGLGKAQLALQTQHLLDAGPAWDVVLCVGTASALVYALAPGDVVVATETVEPDIRNAFGAPVVPRFRSANAARLALQAAGAAQATGAPAVAWEGAGGARACHFSGVPYVEVSGITDHADSQTATDFRYNLSRAMRHHPDVTA